MEDRARTPQLVARARSACGRAWPQTGGACSIDAEVFCDVGAYGIFPEGQVLECWAPDDPARPYELHHYRYVTHSLATNKAPQGAYRGVGCRWRRSCASG